MLDADLVSFVMGALPPAPARVLEVGAGSGELAEHLRAHDYDVLAIDPTGSPPGVTPVALNDVDEPAGSFAAALAVLSLHHVEPLTDSCRRLAELVPPGGVLVIDEFDTAAFDLTAAHWRLERRYADDAERAHAKAMLNDLHAHLHPLAKVLAALGTWFEFGELERGPYLYRWGLTPETRAAEEEAIASGQLAATGARVVGQRL